MQDIIQEGMKALEDVYPLRENKLKGGTLWAN